jgi:sugar lactone lactonase YvrE
MVDVYVPGSATIGEGPVWDPALQALIWVDIAGRRVHLSTPDATRTYATRDFVGAAVPRAGGGLVLATGPGFSTLDLGSGEVTEIATVPADFSAIRFNDGKTDPAGRFWAGTMHLQEEAGRGALYRLDGPGQVARMVEPVSISNGLGWSADGSRMFYIDSPARTVAEYEFDVGTGALGARSTLVDTSGYEGVPDGLTTDADGNLWVAFFDGACIRCFSAEDGTQLAELPLPVTRVTSCTFGGPDLDLLLITSARNGLSAGDLADQPLAGSVLAAEVGVRGVPPTPAVV